jgi:hypothetical protein
MVGLKICYGWLSMDVYECRVTSMTVLRSLLEP